MVWAACDLGVAASALDAAAWDGSGEQKCGTLNAGMSLRCACVPCFTPCPPPSPAWRPQVLSLSQLNTVVLEHSSKILAAAEARKAALGITPSPSAASKAPTPVWGGKLGAKPGAKAGKGKRKARGKGLEEEVLDVEMSVVAPEPEAYCPELQAFLLRLADGLKPVQEALKQRQVRGNRA